MDFKKYKLKMIVVMNENDNLGYTDYELYCIADTVLDHCVETGDLELASDILRWLQRVEMVEVKNNFVELSTEYNKKRLF